MLRLFVGKKVSNRILKLVGKVFFGKVLVVSIRWIKNVDGSVVYGMITEEYPKKIEPNNFSQDIISKKIKMYPTMSVLESLTFINIVMLRSVNLEEVHCQ